VTDTLKDRAKLRASQERRLDHACMVIEGLITLHMPGTLGEREIAELSMMKSRLSILIKHQHVKDREYARIRMEDAWEEDLARTAEGY
jgi:hypothetical protein